MNDDIFSKELQDEFIKNIQALKEETPAADPGKNSPEKKEVNQSKPEKKKAGRKNRGYTAKHKQEYNEYRKQLLNLPQSDTFNSDLIEHVTGEIIPDDNINDFKELYTLTCYSVLENFSQNNPDLVKKHPYNWYKKVLIEIKNNVPAITYKDLDKCIAVWEVLKDFLSSIGLYITYETFQLMTKVYDYQLKSMEKSSPAYADFRKKIFIERDTALVNEISYNPYNQTNKIFLAKVHGIIEKTEPKQIEVTHTIRNYDTLPMFGDNSGKNS